MYIARGRYTNKIYTQSINKSAVLSFIQGMALPLPEQIRIDQINWQEKTKQAFHVIIKKKTSEGKERHDVYLSTLMSIESIAQGEMTLLNFFERLKVEKTILYLRNYKGKLEAVKLDTQTQVTVSMSVKDILTPAHKLKQNRGHIVNSSVKIMELSPKQQKML